MDLSSQKKAVAWLSVASNSLLVTAKLAIGLAIGSVSVISEAVHSGIDLLAALIACFAVHQAEKPADREHPFGHGKIENVSGTVEALLIFIAAVWIVIEAVKKFIHPAVLDRPVLGVVVMGASCAVNFGVSRLLFRIGRRAHSVALEADAWHLTTDIYTSAGVMAGLLLIWLGGRLAPGVNWNWLDPVAALLVATLILKAAWHLTRHSTRDLLDERLPPDEEQWIRKHIARQSPPICGFHRLRTRRAGLTRFIDFHLLVRGEMTVLESHRIATDIERAIERHFPRSSVTVHIEPCSDHCTDTCRSGCLLPPEEQSRRTPLPAARPEDGNSPDP